MNFKGAKKHVVVGTDEIACHNQGLPSLEPLAGLADDEILLDELFVLGELYLGIQHLPFDLGLDCVVFLLLLLHEPNG